MIMMSTHFHTKLAISLLLTITLLFTIAHGADTNPDVSNQEIVGWFEGQYYDTLPSFNLRITPIIFDIKEDSRIQIRLPEFTTLTVDYPHVTCTLRSSGNLRYTYQGLEVQVDAKRARQTVHSVAFTLPSQWFQPEVHSLLVTCHGLDISAEHYNDQVMNTPTSPQFYTYIETTKRQYTLIDQKESYNKTTGRQY